MAPNSVILDTCYLVGNLRRLSSGITSDEGVYFVTDLIEDLFTCFHNAKTAERLLRAFVMEIKAGKYEYGYTLVDTRIGEVVWQLGCSIFEQLKNLRMFLPDGTLPYYYFAIHDKNFNDILLRRLYDLPDLTTTSGASQG